MPNNDRYINQFNIKDLTSEKYVLYKNKYIYL